MVPVPQHDTAGAALSELCETPPAAGTRGQEDVLKALLPLTRSDEGRSQFGAAPNALKHLVAMVDDAGVCHTDAGVLCVRLMRNLCARHKENQSRLADLDAHGRILDCIEQRLDRFDGDSGATPAALRRIDGPESGGARLRLPFFGFCCEFLVNFITGHADNAELVWERMFPEMFREVLDSANPAAAVAAAALVHNCIAVLPDRIVDVVKIWEGERSLVAAILADVDEQSEDRLFWAVLVVKRLVEAKLLSKAFNALGPALAAILAQSSKDFSSPQKTLLEVLDAAMIKSAARSAKDNVLDVRIPEESYAFLSELLEIAVMKANSAVMLTALSLAGSSIIMCPDSARLCGLRNVTVKVGCETLRMVEKQSSNDGVRNGHVDIPGLRLAAVRSVALACDNYTAAQDKVRELKALPLVLNCLKYESDTDRNPTMREWGVMAVRNLCAKNVSNQQAIGEYELQAVQTDDEVLNKIGMEAVVDSATGKVKLKPKQPQ